MTIKPERWRGPRASGVLHVRTPEGRRVSIRFKTLSAARQAARFVTWTAYAMRGADTCHVVAAAMRPRRR